MLSGSGAFSGDHGRDRRPRFSKRTRRRCPRPRPAGARRVVRRCLEKRPEDRFSSARDLAFALEAVSGSGQLSTPAAGVPQWSEAVDAHAGAGRGDRLSCSRPSSSLSTSAGARRQSQAFRPRQSLPPDAGREGRKGAAISPDGRYVAYFVSDDKGRMGLWVQQVATSSAVQVVPPTESVICSAMFSPDGNYVYYCSYPPTKKRLPTLPGSRPGGGPGAAGRRGHRHRTHLLARRQAPRLRREQLGGDS